MKMQRFLTPLLVVATCASAQAAMQLVSLPTLPLSLPSKAVPEAVILPGRIDPGAVALPSAIPLGPTTLPSLPIPVPSIKPGVRLPGPRIGQVLPVKLAAAVDEQQPAERQDDKLERVYDGRAPRRRTFELHEDGYHTIPEQDLIREIGIGSY